MQERHFFFLPSAIERRISFISIKIHSCQFTYLLTGVIVYQMCLHNNIRSFITCIENEKEKKELKKEISMPVQKVNFHEENTDRSYERHYMQLV
jgi:hypothetical protein